MRVVERLRPLEQKRKANQRDALYQRAKAHIARHDFAHIRDGRVHVAVVIPALDEEASIGGVIRDLRAG